MKTTPVPDDRTRHSSQRTDEVEVQAWPGFGGDVRAGSVKRVASAVGEGSVVISAVHSFLGGNR